MVRLSRLRLNMEDGRIDRAILKDHSEIAVGSSSTVFTGVGGAYTVDMTAGNTYSLILNANCSFTFSNPTGSGNACSFTLILKQNVVGSRTVTWPVAVSWQSAVAPVLGIAPGDYDIFSFITMDGGTKWFGSVAERDHINGAGMLFTWGQGLFGPLGTNSVTNASSPTQVGLGSDWNEMSMSSATGAIKTNGTLWTWGVATYGKLADNNSTVARSSPAQVGVLINWAKVSVGTSHAAAIKTDGTLWTWGRATAGRLGNSDAVVSRSSPIQVGGGTTWAQLAIGSSSSSSLALKTDGSMWAWGTGTSGQLGNNTSVSNSSPVQIGAGSTWVQIAMNSGYCFAIKNDGTFWSWGAGGALLGQNDIISRSSPAQVGALTDWAQIAAGVAVKTDGTIWSWGSNNLGQLGHNDIINRSSPAQVGILATWAHVAGGSSHALAIKIDGTLWSWGSYSGGALGQNDATSRSSPTQVGTNTFWTMVGGGTAASIARRFTA